MISNLNKMMCLTGFICLAPMFVAANHPNIKHVSVYLIVGGLFLVGYYYFSMFSKIFSAGNKGKLFVYFLAVYFVVESLALLFLKDVYPRTFLALMFGSLSAVISFIFAKMVYCEYKDVIDGEFNKVNKE